MIDPQANLAAVEPDLADAEWITDAPSGPPTLHRRLQLTAGR